jgi:hypothetical protein
MVGCPYLENRSSVVCFSQCKSERINGQRKVCVGSQFDPIPLTTIEVVATGLTDEKGNELYEIYQAKEYTGSCYATSARDARNKASAGELIEVVS